MSPTARALKWLRDAGYLAAITERWNPHAHIRQDLFGFADLVAVGGGKSGVLFVQVTSGSNHAARRTKLLGIPAARQCLEAGNRIWVMSFALRGAKGKRKRYEPRLDEIGLGDFEEAAACVLPAKGG